MAQAVSRLLRGRARVRSLVAIAARVWGHVSRRRPLRRSFVITALFTFLVTALLLAYVLTGHAAKGLVSPPPITLPL